MKHVCFLLERIIPVWRQLPVHGECQLQRWIGAGQYYGYDGGTPVAVQLSGGNTQFTITEPPVGNQNVVIDYAQQTNYAAAQPQTENFTVTSAPVQVSLTPSTWKPGDRRDVFHVLLAARGWAGIEEAYR